MTTQTQLQVVAKKAEQGLAAAIQRIDAISSGAMEIFSRAGSFESEIQVALVIRDLHAALTPEVMEPFMALMNTDLGFRTDRDPRLIDGKTGKPYIPYTIDEVRPCLIESKLRGFHSVGNEWNIIAGRFYACKNGLKRKVEQTPGVTDLRIDYGVPKLSERGAITPVVATWKRDGIAQRIEAEIPVRVNSGMGTDAIMGKVQRKIHARINDRLTGIYTDDGDVDEAKELSQGVEKTPLKLPAKSEPEAK